MAQFSVANGQIIDPSGNQFVARGINVFPGQVDAATILQTFPGINAIRLAATPGSDPNTIDSLVQGLTSKGVVVLIEDHSSSGGNPNTLSGQALANEASWYAGLAGKYANNPDVWFGTANEPDNSANLQAIPDQEKAIYDAIRGTGSKAMVALEERGGGYSEDAIANSPGTFANMTNVVWDTHYYGWLTNYNTDPTVLANSIKSQIAAAQSVKSADGLVPVIIGEYGPSTTGSGAYDANGMQVVQAVDSSGKGTFAWAYNAGTDALTNGSGLTDFGKVVAAHIATGTPPASASPPVLSAPSVVPTPPLVGSGVDTMVLNLSEDAYLGDARFSVTVDGKALGAVQSVAALHGSGQTEAFSFKGSFGPGTHSVDVSFLNDAWGGSAATDRNLYIDKATFNGTQVQGAAELGQNGTVSFAVTGSAAATPPVTTPVTAPPATPVTTLPALGTDTLVLSLAEDAWQGDAQAVITLDGKTIGGTVTVTALHSQGKTQAVTLTGQWGPGAHDVGVQFINDAYGGTPATDRNLYVNAVSYDGQAAATPPATLFSNGATHAATPASPLVLQLSEDAYQGDAQFSVSVDGKAQGPAQSVTTLHSSGTAQDFGFNVAMPAGTHDVAVSFLNDAYAGTATTDRNLYVNAIDANAAAMPGTAAALMSTGTQHFSVVVPAHA